MKKSDLLRALQLEIQKHNLSSMPKEPRWFTRHTVPSQVAAASLESLSNSGGSTCSL
jgi:hypothetical protein